MKKQILLILSFLFFISCNKEYKVEVYEKTDKSFFASESKTNTFMIKEKNDNDAYEAGYRYYIACIKTNKMLKEKGISNNEIVTGFNVYNNKKENIKDNINYDFIIQLEKKYKFALE